MLLGKNEVPFTDNPACKSCMNKPCKSLLAGSVQCGKVIFVRRSDMMSIPSYTPSWKKKAKSGSSAAGSGVASDSSGTGMESGLYAGSEAGAAGAAEPAALTDNLEVIEGTIEISNPVWQHKDEELLASMPDKALGGVPIQLSADVKNYPEGASVTFDVYDVSDGTPFLIKSVSGKHEGGVAKASWVVEDPQKRGEALKLAFEAGARSKYTPRADIPLLAKLTCDFVEMPDILFNHGSAVPCLDSEGVLIGALVAAFTFAKYNPDREVVLFGHADTSGDPSYNYDLSGWRAEGIKALCDNNSEAFLDIVDLASKVEDYQTILKSLSSGYGWPTDPGAVDNVAGENTKAAIKAFQQEYNSRFSGNLVVDLVPQNRISSM